MKIRVAKEARVHRGEKIRTGKGWRLVSPGKGRGFKATLITTIQAGGEKVAIFRVLPHPESE